MDDDLDLGDVTDLYEEDTDSGFRFYLDSGELDD